MGDIRQYSDSELKTPIGLNREQFDNLYSYTTRALIGRSVVYHRDLFVFLVKFRTGLSDEFLRVMFNVALSTISRIVILVRRNLMQTFVKYHLGLAAHPRDLYIENHVPLFAQALYNSKDPANRKAIVIIDSTYIYTHKSSNYRVLRQTFSQHKSRHLVKIGVLVSPSGRILATLPPYFADGKNNDASILRAEMEKDNSLKQWLQKGDILIVDRGYRDILEYLKGLGIETFSPSFLPSGKGTKKQLDCYEANASRLPAKNRWVVEARNAHAKNIWRFLNQFMPIIHVKHIGDYFDIACALINAYYCPITMGNATPAMAMLMLERPNVPNVVPELVMVDNQLRRT